MLSDDIYGREFVWGVDLIRQFRHTCSAAVQINEKKEIGLLFIEELVKQVIEVVNDKHSKDDFISRIRSNQFVVSYKRATKEINISLSLLSK